MQQAHVSPGPAALPLKAMEAAMTPGAEGEGSDLSSICPKRTVATPILARIRRG